MKRKVDQTRTDTAKRSTTIVTGFKSNVPDLEVAIEKVNRIVAETTTLATKLGTLFILSNQDSLLDLCLDQTFWNWCMEMVSTTKGKETNSCKVVEHSVHAPRGVKRKKDEPSEGYLARKKAHESKLATALAEMNSSKVKKPKKLKARGKRESEEEFQSRHAEHLRQAEAYAVHETLRESYRLTRFEQTDLAQLQLEKEEKDARKNKVKPALFDFWKDLRSEIQEANPNWTPHPRDHLGYLQADAIATIVTSVRNSFSTTFEKRLSKAFSTEASKIIEELQESKLPGSEKVSKKDAADLRAVIVGCLFSIVKRTPLPKWQERRKALFDERIDMDRINLVAAEYSVLLPDEGKLDPDHIFKNCHLYLRAAKFLQTKGTKTSFLPQFDPKARHLMLNVHGLSNLLAFSHKVLGFNVRQWLPEDLANVYFGASGRSHKFPADVDLEKLYKHLFRAPKFRQGVKRFAGVMKTDGIKACWLFEVVAVAGPKRLKVGPPPTSTLDQLKKGKVYENGKDVILVDGGVQVRRLYADPGHVTLLSGVEEVEGEAFDPKTCRKFRIGNKEYRSMAGMSQRRNKANSLRNEDSEYQEACADLSSASSKTWDPGEYRTHVLCLAKHWQGLFEHSFLPYVRRHKFLNYRGKQRAISQIVAKLVPGDRSRTVLVVGNGCRSATSRGHDSAPGKSLRKALCKYFPVVLCDERNSSARTCCCPGVSATRGHYDSKAKHKRSGESIEGRRIRGLAHCPSCGSTVDRDTSAAVNIARIFRSQLAEGRPDINPLLVARD